MRLKIGLLSVYFGLFDDAMPGDFRKSREKYTNEVKAFLDQFGDVTFPGLIDSEEEAESAAKIFKEAELDLIVFAPSMAAPPSYGWIAVKDIPETFIVALAAQEYSNVPDDYDTEQATKRSLPVGLVMFTNVLARNDRRFTSVLGTLDNKDLSDELESIFKGISAAKSVTGNNFLIIGKPIKGYIDVEASLSDLDNLNVNTVEINKNILNREYKKISKEKINLRSKKIRSDFSTKGLDDETLENSTRLTLAIEEICTKNQIRGGAFNCHGDVFRFNPEIGVTACLAVTELAKKNLSFACTGDLPAGIALTIGKEISGSSLYCELYQLDIEENWLLVANGGEGDTSIHGGKEEITLLPEDHYMGENGPGVAVAFDIKKGPSTLLSLTPISKPQESWRLIVAEGEIIDSRHTGMEGPNGMFRFNSGEVKKSYAQWCDMGATHHAALIPGVKRKAINTAAAALGIEVKFV
jgi:L-arabinose isomerase